MKLLGHGRLPDEAHATVFAASPLVDGERVLQWAALEATGWVAATNLGLRFPGDYLLVRWEEVDHVAYEDLAMELTFSAGRPRVELRLVDPRRFPEVVRDRVNASIAYDRHVPLVEGAGVRIVGRRRSDTGEISWLPAYDDALDVTDPVVVARAADALEEARALFG